MSKSELARRIGVHPSACIQWEAVGGTHPKLEHLARIATILDVRFEWLATGRGEMRYSPQAREERPARGSLDRLLNAEERRLLESFRAMDARRRRLLLELTALLGGEV